MTSGVAKRPVAVLAAIPVPEDATRLAGIADIWGWDLRVVPTADEALHEMAGCGYPVVLADAALEGAGWRALMRAARALDMPPRVIVTAYQPPNALWGEVLREGGEEILRKPFVEREIVHAVVQGWRKWRVR